MDESFSIYCDRVREMDRRACATLARHHSDRDTRAEELLREREEAERERLARMRRAKLGVAEVSPILIFREVSKVTGVPVQTIKGPGGDKQVIAAKRLAIWCLHERGKLSKTAIGNLMGGMDRATVRHHLRRYIALNAVSPAPVEVPFR